MFFFNLNQDSDGNLYCVIFGAEIWEVGFQETVRKKKRSSKALKFPVSDQNAMCFETIKGLITSGEM